MAPGRLLLLLASTLALGLAAYSVWVTPPSIPVALLCALGYVILLGVGSMVPRLQMYGEVLYQVPEAAGHLALTFDDGPDPTSTSLVLDVLKARGHRATFFVLGMRAAAHPDLIERMVAEGHSVGIHSYDHYRAYALLPPRAVERDIAGYQEVLTQAGASDIGWFRPPVGQLSPRTFAGLKSSRIDVQNVRQLADALRGDKILLAGNESAALGLLALLFVGAGFLVVIASTNTSIQMIVADEMRGGVMSIRIMGFTLAFPLGSLAQGALADAWGPRQTVTVFGAMLLAFAVYLALKPSLLRTLDAETDAVDVVPR